MGEKVERMNRRNESGDGRHEGGDEQDVVSSDGAESNGRADKVLSTDDERNLHDLDEGEKPYKRFRVDKVVVCDGGEEGGESEDDNRQYECGVWGWWA